MNGFILLIILVLLILLITILNRTGEQSRLLESLYDKIKELSNEVSILSKQLKEKKEGYPVKSVLSDTLPKTEIKETPLLQAKPAVPQPMPDEKVAIVEVPAGDILNPKAVPAYKPAFETKTKQDTDIEKFIGENLANKIGIAVLVLGIAFL